MPEPGKKKRNEIKGGALGISNRQIKLNREMKETERRFQTPEIIC
jgi:hypothetical protein